MSARNVLTNFKIINTEEKAYWLGFLYADGSVGSKEDKIELGLAAKDLHHIEKFKAFIGLPNKISYRESTNSYRFSFRSTNCKQDLIDKGCVPKKSLILTWPSYEQVPKELMRHFIRGYFDGDGWFTNTESCFQAGLIGTRDFLEGFLNELMNQVTTTNTIFSVHREDGAKRYVFNSLQDVYTFLTYIYKDSNIYLDRKYEAYQDFIINGSKYHKNMKLPDIKET